MHLSHIIVGTSDRVGIPSQPLKSRELGDLPTSRWSAPKTALKQVAVLGMVAGITLLVLSSGIRKGEAAGWPVYSAGFSAKPLFSNFPDNTKFDHAKHNQIKCDQCHVRRADAIKPVLPGHRACIGCHIKEFTSTQFAICSNCHEGIKAIQPKLLEFPERQTFGTEFSHKTHATYVSGEKRADCSSCHEVAGPRATFPAHRECYVCHKAPDQVKVGEKVGGASCSVCHTPTGDKKPPSAMSRAYNYRFTHQVHAQREGINCTECHKVLGEAATQVSLPQLKEHRGAGFQACGSCHNGRRAFGGELANNACARCHGRNMM
jgi:c(7)-type cytochrome triheme protein